jgi:hypothetical protein
MVIRNSKWSYLGNIFVPWGERIFQADNILLILTFVYEKLKSLLMSLHETIPIAHQPNIETVDDSVCPVCSRDARGNFVSLSSLDGELAELIRANAPDRDRTEVACLRCIRLFERAKDQIIADAAVLKDGSHVLSTPLRLDADERFTGKGVTIAFLDSGFYPHVDLTTPKNRIVAYHSLVDPAGGLESLFKPHVASWHGIIT